MSASSSTSRGRNALLWTVQGLIAAVFLFSGAVKLKMPVAVLAQVSKLPGGFMKFIAVCELVGAVGLVLPGLLRIKPGLTVLAAVGLAIIMVGATIVTIAIQGIAPAAVPFIVGCLLVVIIRGRRDWASWRAPAVEDRDSGTGSATAGA
jgi:DoxX-like family